MPSIAELGARAKAASRVLATASTAEKDAALLAAADLLIERVDDVLAANAEDVEREQAAGASATVLDRLRLTPARVEGMAIACFLVGSSNRIEQLACQSGAGCAARLSRWRSRGGRGGSWCARRRRAARAC